MPRPSYMLIRVTAGEKGPEVALRGTGLLPTAKHATMLATIVLAVGELVQDMESAGADNYRQMFEEALSALSIQRGVAHPVDYMSLKIFPKPPEGRG